MEISARADQLRSIIRSLNDLIAFADGEHEYAIAANLDAVRVRLIEKYSQEMI